MSLENGAKLSTFLSLSDIQEALDAPLTDVFHLKYPKEGDVRYKAIMSTTELEGILSLYRKLKKQKDSGVPALKDYSDMDLQNACYLLACLTEPRLPTIDAALKTCSALGPQATMLQLAISNLSGMGQLAKDEEEVLPEETALEREPFPVSDDGDVSGVSAPSSKRSKSHP